MSKKKLKKNSGRFVGVPYPLVQSKAYTELSPLSKALLLELAAQYNARNNGYLSMTREDLKARSFKSPGSNQKAIEALIDAGIITKTIQGGIANGKKHASLYGINWQPSDERSDRPFQYSLDEGIAKYRSMVLDSEKISVLKPRKQNQRPDLRLVKAV